MAGLEGLTPHGLRATFVTITLENGASLEQVQYAVGHSDPRTTERYHKRKLNLENNAVDYFRL
jgi:integrase